MEQAEKEMKGISEMQQNSIKRYLLGSLDDTVEMRQIEEKILLDDDFAEQISIAEDELVDDYLDGTLAETERERFLNFFLVSPEIEEKVRLVGNLRKYAAKQTAVPQNVKQFAEAKPDRFDWRRLFGAPAWQFAAVALVLFGIGFGVWRTAFHQSDAERGLAELRLAYRGERPIESRTTANFEYAALTETRGNSTAAGDEKARRRAELLLSEAEKNSPNAETHHALGLLYLTDRKYEQSLEEFNRALKFAPANAKIHSDAGAASLEMGKKAVAEKDGAQALTFFDQSLGHLDKAIELDPALLEPRFNRALCLQALPIPEQAKQAWREYLQLDADSPWAAEAKRHLQLLESQTNRERSATELERDFILAVQEKNAENAWRLLSRNRELIREKYLPQRLAMSYLTAADDDKENFRRALEYAGELDLARIGDPFAAEIASFYEALPSDKIGILGQAHRAVRSGYELCLKQRYSAALDEFRAAHDLFLQAENIWEAKLSEYFISYCLINSERTSDAVPRLRGLIEFSQNGKYKWLEVTTHHWLAGSLLKMRQHTQAKKSYETALALAEAINDPYAIQRNLLDLAALTSLVGQKDASLGYLRRVLEESNAPEISFRQKHRNYVKIVEALAAAKLYSAAKPISLEAVRLGDELGDRMFAAISRNNVGVAYVQTGNFNEARQWLAEGLEKADSIGDESSRKKMIAYSFLKSGYLERQTGNYEESRQLYHQALVLYETMEIPPYSFEAQKGKLLADLALGKSAELEKQIPLTLKFAEDFRETILEEQERTSFFDGEASIYDIAVDYELGRENYERAYDYAETSSSRSLLDWLQKGRAVSSDKKADKFFLEESANPSTLAEIRRQMPEKTQILQYSVLEKKVVIWLVSKEKFVVAVKEIETSELRRKVENYVKLLQRNNDAAARTTARQLSRELYDLLISPIFSQLDPQQDICLIPSKVLFYLPFAALVAPDEQFFLTDFNIFYSPSANVFLLCTENARGKNSLTEETLLSVGNPAFDSRRFDKLRDLSSAETEARQITAFYEKSQTFYGRAATKPAFVNSIKNAEVIHFAGHYVVAHNAPLSSHLLLATSGGGDAKPEEDGILTNSELITADLPRAKLIVLSACQTGVEHYYNGEGMIGLSRTFLAAGAPLVVASQWSVETEATARLMQRFHFYRRQEKMTAVAALRSAQLEMLSDSDERLREPYYWAAFAAFGGYANF